MEGISLYILICIFIYIHIYEPRMRWLDDVESDLKKMKVKGWKEKMRNREQWRLVVEEAKAHPEL
jgi:hypothetical protein